MTSSVIEPAIFRYVAPQLNVLPRAPIDQIPLKNSNKDEEMDGPNNTTGPLKC